MVLLLVGVGPRFSFCTPLMFSPSEYLTNLRQISLLNGLVIPRGQLSSIPQIPQMQSAPGGIPVVAVVGFPTNGTECNDFINAVASFPLAINLAALFAAGLIITFLVKRYGPHILGWFRSKMHQFLAVLRCKIRNKRSTLLQPASYAVVLG